MHLPNIGSQLNRLDVSFFPLGILSVLLIPLVRSD